MAGSAFLSGESPQGEESQVSQLGREPHPQAGAALRMGTVQAPASSLREPPLCLHSDPHCLGAVQEA